MILAKLIAVLSTGLFSGAAIYINFVEHPARMSCGVEIALKQWRPSYQRATVMQATLALIGFFSSVTIWFLEGNILFLIAGLLIGSVIPFTLLIIYPTNRKLMDPATALTNEQTEKLLTRWNSLHLVRSILSFLSFLFLLTAALK